MSDVNMRFKTQKAHLLMNGKYIDYVFLFFWNCKPECVTCSHFFQSLLNLFGLAGSILLRLQ